MQVNAYLNYNGRCAEALTYYQEKLGARLEAMFTHGESPVCDQIPPGWQDKVMHACLFFGDTQLMACDAPPDMYEKAQGFSVALNVDTAAEAEKAFAALRDGGAVTMELQETFWAQRFGAVTDRFGIPWMVNGGFKEFKPDS